MGRAQKKAARRRPRAPPEARIAKANETDEHHRPRFTVPVSRRREGVRRLRGLS